MSVGPLLPSSFHPPLLDSFLSQSRAWVGTLIGNGQGATLATRQALANKGIEILKYCDKENERIKNQDSENLDDGTNRDSAKLYVAKLRSSACNMFAASLDKLTRQIKVDEYVMLVKFNLKAAQSWLDAENFEKASNFANSAEMYWNTMLKCFPNVQKAEARLIFAVLFVPSVKSYAPYVPIAKAFPLA